ncbi:MAG: aminoglycoside phosphotransferase family protein [Raineya sp.]|jgi:hypothetical protein|nr:aminoglycoside phosphotransferase family protein [Raineya sp.]
MNTQTPFFLEKEFLEKLMQDFAPETNIIIENVQNFKIDNSASILVALTAQESESKIGHFGVEITFTRLGVKRIQKMVLKVKPHSQEIITMLSNLSQACGGELAKVYPRYQEQTGFYHTHQREQEIYKKIPSELTPTIFGVYTDENEGLFMILMEYLEDVSLLNAVMQPQNFTDKYIKTTLNSLAHWHSSVKSDKLNSKFWMDTPSKAYMQDLQPLWIGLVENAHTHHSDLYTTKRVEFLKKAIEDIPQHWEIMDKYPKTLIHNDCNPRNICFKILDNQPKLCLYDWELATLHAPQYDLVEFLCFTLDKERHYLRSQYIDEYYKTLSHLDNRFNDRTLFLEILQISALHFGLHRLGMYMMAHAVSPYPFLPFVVENYFAWFDL